jgi:hypothetical protein
VEIVLSVAGVVLACLSLIVGVAQLLRMPKPKPEPEPFTPTCLTILGVPIHHGRDRLGL